MRLVSLAQMTEDLLDRSARPTLEHVGGIVEDLPDNRNRLETWHVSSVSIFHAKSVLEIALTYIFGMGLTRSQKTLSSYWH
jgi:hypothetical protein